MALSSSNLHSDGSNGYGHFAYALVELALGIDNGHRYHQFFQFHGWS